MFCFGVLVQLLTVEVGRRMKKPRKFGNYISVEPDAFRMVFLGFLV